MQVERRAGLAPYWTWCSGAAHETPSRRLVRIGPVDIDKISVGQPAQLRFSAFNPDATPQFAATVLAVSADAIIDETTGAPCYEATIEISDEALASSKFQLVPGMPVEAMLRTESRNVLSYLVKPLTDSVSRVPGIACRHLPGALGRITPSFLHSTAYVKARRQY